MYYIKFDDRQTQEYWTLVKSVNEVQMAKNEDSNSLQVVLTAEFSSSFRTWVLVNI